LDKLFLFLRAYLHPKEKGGVMNIKRIISIGLSLIIFCLAFTSSSCKSRKAGCDANGQYKTKKMKKNRSSYGTRYDYKNKPVKKSYVIRNSR
jgi:hypothetical protein